MRNKTEAKSLALSPCCRVLVLTLGSWLDWVVVVVLLLEVAVAGAGVLALDLSYGSGLIIPSIVYERERQTYTHASIYRPAPMALRAGHVSAGPLEGPYRPTIVAAKYLKTKAFLSSVSQRRKRRRRHTYREYADVTLFLFCSLR